MRARQVAAEKISTVMGEAWVDTTRRPYVKDGVAWIPVHDTFDADSLLPERTRYAGPGYRMFGDIAVLGEEPSPEDLRALIDWKNPKGVVVLSSIHSAMRLPTARLIWGQSGDVCIHENGLKYWMDPTKVMFSAGNREEKRILSGMVAASPSGERIADMFAGIGYFSISCATAGGRVHAMELNPVSHDYLMRNLKANHVEEQVIASCGDCRDLLSGIYDRIVMGHFDAVEYLSDALAHTRTGTMLHLHSLDDQTEHIRQICAESGKTCTIEARRVKKYGPGRWHMVHDVVI